MRLMSIRSALAVSLVLLCTLSLIAAGPAIGFAVADGGFRVDNSTVRGNGSVFEGSTIITDRAASRLQFDNGARLQLAADSQVQVYRTHAVLVKGLGQIQAPANYRVEARSLRIVSAEPNTVAQVRVGGGHAVLVAAVSGAVRVTNSQGSIVADVAAGHSVSLDPQAGASGPIAITGTVQKVGNVYVVKDATTGVTFEVKGAGVEKMVGKNVSIQGAAASTQPSAAGASQVVDVANVTPVSSASGGGGLSTTAKVAIVGGVVVGGTLGGLAAAGTFSSSSPTTAASR